jgi:hypothetical protein
MVCAVEITGDFEKWFNDTDVFITCDLENRCVLHLQVCPLFIHFSF